ncbi:hypothetical protein JKG47_11815 [Acidithiobacillus sp. MC6.1]|nr:hypothetical protein [Acidithiobacillus sp. MC6.1]
MTSHNGKTFGGAGVKGSFFQDNFLASVNYHHDFGSQFSTRGITSGGSTNDANLKLAYLVPISKSLYVGPYLSYQYQNLNNNTEYLRLHNDNNAIGGGGYMAYGAGPLTITGNVGYLAGVSASASFQGYGMSASRSEPSSNVLQLGLQTSYQLSGPWYAFTAFKWDQYNNRGYSQDFLQGDLGLGYSF